MRFQMLPQILASPFTEDTVDRVAFYQKLFREPRKLVRPWLARMIVDLRRDTHIQAIR